MNKNNVNKLSDFEKKSITALADLVKDRAKTLEEFDRGIQYFFDDPAEYEQKGISKHFKSGLSGNYLAELLDILSEEMNFCSDYIESAIRSFADKKQVNAGNIIHPVRLAVTGRTASPGIFEVMEILGKEKVVRRNKLKRKTENFLMESSAWL